MAQFTVNATRFDPYKNFKFRVKWDGRYVAGVSKVGALKRTTEVVEHREGGDPSTSRKSPGRTKYEAITLERGVTHDAEFERWANKVWNFGAGPGRRRSRSQDFRKDITIEVYNEAGPEGARLQRLPLLGVGVPGAAGPRRQRQRRRHPDHQARERGLGARPRRDRAGRADLQRPARLGMEQAVEVRLPGGVVVDGARRTDARLRRLNGHDQEALLALAGAPAARAGRVLLDRCLGSIGGRAAAGDAVGGLAVGDREALLWQLRLVSLGDRLAAVVECRHCHEKLDVDLRVGDLLQPAYPEWGDSFTEDFAGRRVWFRLPTVADHEAVLDVARADGELAARSLLGRCVVAVDGHPATDGELVAVGPAVEERVAALDPQAETVLDIHCPHCGASTAHALDAAEFLVEELTRTGRYLFQEVHTLAWYYHWGEDEILGLTVDKRRRYLELIQDSMGAGP